MTLSPVDQPLHVQLEPQDRGQVQGQGRSRRSASVTSHRQVALDRHLASTGSGEEDRVVTRIQHVTVEILRLLMVLPTEGMVVVEAGLRNESQLQEAPSTFSTNSRAQPKAGLIGRDR